MSLWRKDISGFCFFPKRDKLIPFNYEVLPIQPYFFFSWQESPSWPKNKEEATVFLRPHSGLVPGRWEIYEHAHGVLNSGELSSKGLCKYTETLQSQDKKRKKGRKNTLLRLLFFHVMPRNKCPMMSNIRWYLLFSIRLFRKDEAQPIRVGPEVRVASRLCETAGEELKLHSKICF